MPGWPPDIRKRAGTQTRAGTGTGGAGGLAARLPLGPYETGTRPLRCHPREHVHEILGAAIQFRRR